MNALLTLVAPGCGAGEVIDWGAVSAAWGTRFPDDYVDFMGVYGEGVMSEHLYILHPLSTAGDATHCQMRQETATACAVAARLGDVAGLPKGSPYPLIAWGVTTGPDILCWVTEDSDPNSWPVAVFGRHTEAPVALYDCGMVEFLRSLLHGAFPVCPVSGAELWGRRDVKFLHWREQKRLWAAGVNPWTGEPDPYADEEWD
ncbi:SMI1/KNR4 family protein [Streptomyces mashuensis]|uniref:SMI1/KNR4 family protein n=1 Tax=Streptomyces mashuensis TaxID=33904 RepID=UPI00167E510D|nr:SMI1/KNR4 family protein [Streptomyces mashuensis]